QVRSTYQRLQPAAIIATAASASTIPTTCHRVTRSRSTTIASSTVAAGYSDISTPASDNSDACSAISIAMFAAVSSSAASTASFNGTPVGGRRLELIAAMTTTTTLAERRAKTSGQSLASTGAWWTRTQFSPTGRTV